jgi:hypothetical protein
MTAPASQSPHGSDRTSLLLPSGATLSVIAALIEGFGEPELMAQAFALFGALSAVGAWVLVARKGRGVSKFLGVRFFSILAIALAISSLFVSVQAGWLGSVGVIGLWLASTGAGIEWLRGRTLGVETAG